MVVGSSPTLPAKIKILIDMKKVVITVILAAIAIAALVWACSFKISGLAWFPGFFVAVFCLVKILEVHKVGQNDKAKHPAVVGRQ